MFFRLLNQWIDFKVIIQKCSLVTFYRNCSNRFALLNKMATRARDK